MACKTCPLLLVTLQKKLLSVSYPMSQGCEIANCGLDRRLRYRWQSVAKSYTWPFQSEIDALLLISIVSYVCSQKNLILTCSYYRLNSSNDYQLLILWLWTSSLDTIYHRQSMTKYHHLACLTTYRQIVNWIRHIIFLWFILTGTYFKILYKRLFYRLPVVGLNPTNSRVNDADYQLQSLTNSAS